MRGARAVHQAVLQDFPDADIGVSIVWIDMLPTDNAAAAEQLAATIRDQRVRHFHDARSNRLAGSAFANGLVRRGPAWDIYLFYAKGAEWTDAPPPPVEWWHQLSGGDRADAERFAAGVLEEKLHESMHSVTGAMCDARAVRPEPRIPESRAQA